MPQPCPAVSPDQTKDMYASLGGRGAEVPELRLAGDAVLVEVFEPHAIENVLPRRQAVEQQL